MTPKQKLVSVARDLNLYDFLAEIGNKFGQIENCQIEEIKEDGSVSVVAGYRTRKIVLNSSLELPICCLISNKRKVRVFELDGVINFIPLQAQKGNVLFVQEECLKQRVNVSKIAPSTGY